MLNAGACRSPAPASAAPDGGVVPGIEVFLANVPSALRGKRVGMVLSGGNTDFGWLR